MSSLGWPQTYSSPPASASRAAGIIGMHPCTWPKRPLRKWKTPARDDQCAACLSCPGVLEVQFCVSSPAALPELISRAVSLARQGLQGVCCAPTAHSDPRVGILLLCMLHPSPSPALSIGHWFRATEGGGAQERRGPAFQPSHLCSVPLKSKPEPGGPSSSISDDLLFSVLGLNPVLLYTHTTPFKL